MIRHVQTYSSKGSSCPVTQRTVSFGIHNLFDQIHSKENVFDNTNMSQLNESGKRPPHTWKKVQAKKLSRRIKEVCLEEDESSEAEEDSLKDHSPKLFHDDDQAISKLKKRTNQKPKSYMGQNRKKRNEKRKGKISEIKGQDFSDGISWSHDNTDDHENAEDLVIEEVMSDGLSNLEESDLTEGHSSRIQALGQALGGNFLKLQDSLNLNFQNMHRGIKDCSIEIPRDAYHSPPLYFGSLNQSPMLPLKLSDEDSLVNQESMSKRAVSETGWVTISSNPQNSMLTYEGKEVTNQSSEVEYPESQYTYTYISTYTETTDTASTNKIRNSPPVKMKLHNVLNSTAYKGKDCLGTIEFPSSISPISQKTAELTAQTKHRSQETAQIKHQNQATALGAHKLNRIRENKERHVPKCSTQLFGSDISSSVPPLGSMNLSTINSRGTLNNSESPTVCSHSRKKAEHVISRMPSVHEDLHVKSTETDKKAHGVEQKSVKTSTPLADAVRISFSISPVELPAFEEDELHVYSSTVVNSDEIIVPSLMDPTRVSKESSHKSEKDGDIHSCSACSGQEYPRKNNTEELGCNRTGQAEPNCELSARRIVLSTRNTGEEPRKQDASANCTCTRCSLTSVQQVMDEYRLEPQVLADIDDSPDRIQRSQGNSKPYPSQNKQTSHCGTGFHRESGSSYFLLHQEKSRDRIKKRTRILERVPKYKRIKMLSLQKASTDPDSDSGLSNETSPIDSHKSENSKPVLGQWRSEQTTDICYIYRLCRESWKALHMENRMSWI